MSESNIFLKKNKNDSQENSNKLSKFMNIQKEIEPIKKYHGDEDIVFNSNPNYIKKDILLFKDEVLKDIKIFQSKIYEKAKSEERYMNEKIEKFSHQIQKYSEKIIELSNLICTDKAIRDKVETIMEFKNKTEEKMMTNGIKVDNIDKDFHDNIYRIDNILKDSVLYPGLIGGISKFKTFHDFLDYAVSELSQGITFREKSNLDLNNYKSKLDSAINNFNLRIDSITKASNRYSEKCVNTLENKINSSLDLYNEKLTSIRLENTSYAEEMKKVTDDLLKQVSNVILIKNELFNKFEEQINFVKKENTRVIKCFSGYKEQFYDMKKKFIELSDFIRDVRFKANIKEEFNRRDFYNVSKKIANFKNKRKSAINIENTIFEKNENENIKQRRGSADNPKSLNDFFIKENNNNNKEEEFYKFNFHFSDEELENKSIKKEITDYEKFLKSYQRIDSETKNINNDNDNNNNENNDENNNKNNSLDKKERTHRRHHSHSHRYHHHHHHKNGHHHHHHHHHRKESEDKNEKKENDSIINKEGEFIQRRRNRLATISKPNNNLNIPLTKLFDLTNNDNDNDNDNDDINNDINNNIIDDNKFVRKNQKRLKTQKLDFEMFKKMKKLDKYLINTPKNTKNNSSSNSSFSRNSSFSSCSKCSKSSYTSSSNSDSDDSYSSNIKKKQNNKKNNLVIKEEDESSYNSEEIKAKKINKKINNIEIKVSDFSKEEKEIQSDNKFLKSNQLLLNHLNRNSKTEKSLSYEPKKKIFIKNKTINGNLMTDIQIKSKDNYPNLIITNYQNKDNKSNYIYRNNDSLPNQKHKNFFNSESLKKISLSIEGTNKLVIKPNSKENNKNEKEVIKNVKNIINNYNNKKSISFLPNKTYNGFPKIITNNGERIIQVTRPLFHSKKFVNYMSPNVLALNHSIQALYGNKFKKKNRKDPKMLKSLMVNNSDFILKNKQPYLNIQKNNEYEIALNNNNYIFVNDERINSERQRPAFNDLMIKSNTLINDKYKKKEENCYYNLMMNMDKRK